MRTDKVRNSKIVYINQEENIESEHEDLPNYPKYEGEIDVKCCFCQKTYLQTLNDIEIIGKMYGPVTFRNSQIKGRKCYFHYKCAI